jgi:AraC family transcriptional regulator
MNVEVKQMPKFHVAYIRHIGPYNKIGETFEKIFQWAGPQGLIRFPETNIMAIYHDDPKITPEEKLRSDVCMTVPNETPATGEINITDIPAGKYAVAKFEIKVEEFSEAWASVYSSVKHGHRYTEIGCLTVAINLMIDHMIDHAMRCI